MNSNPRKPTPSPHPGSATSSAAASSFHNYNFDFGLPTSRPSSTRPLQPTTSQSQPSIFPSSQPPPSQQPPSWAQQRATWTHQPKPSGSLSNPTCMVGDIFGKSWTSTTPSSSAGVSVGVVNSNPNLFGDLVGSVLGATNPRAPLKSISPSPPSQSFSTDTLANSLPKPPNFNAATKQSGGFSAPQPRPANSVNFNGFANKGPVMNSSMNSKNDPFASLMDFGSKPAPVGVGDSSFGDFKSASALKVDSPAPSPAPAPALAPARSGGADPFNVFFSSAAPPVAAYPAANTAADDWGFDAEFGGGDVGGGKSTIELDGLPPPPVGVTAPMAKGKGLDHQKGGQYADAIKWLSWAVLLFEKAGDDAASAEILPSRASCYKEVGEYKKAITDCSKKLED